jgi:hypothetical protein
VRRDPQKILRSAPSYGWTPAAESLMIVWDDSGVPRTRKSLIFFDCASPPLGTILPSVQVLRSAAAPLPRHAPLRCARSKIALRVALSTN